MVCFLINFGFSVSCGCIICDAYHLFHVLINCVCVFFFWICSYRTNYFLMIVFILGKGASDVDLIYMRIGVHVILHRCTTPGVESTTPMWGVKFLADSIPV